MHLRSWIWVGVGTWIISTGAAHAQPEIPDVLEPWRDWVLYGEEYRQCPLLSGAMPGERAAHICAWPGTLVLDVAADGAAFEQTWRVAADDWIPLPGDSQLWPTVVMLDGTAVPVVERDGRPSVHAAVGSYTVTGRLSWAERPASIAIPFQSGLVDLTLDGALVSRPEIEHGTLWLGRVAEAGVEEDRLTVSIYRLLSDGLPVRAVTEIRLDVAGESREIELDGALLPGFVAEHLDSALPAELDGGGTLRVQVRPGDWSVRVMSHAAALPDAIAAAAATDPWPAEEIWSYAADTRLRIAVLEGAQPIDSAASEVPGDWSAYPSYRVTAGTTINLNERSRNDADEVNRFSLSRALWLDFAGDGFTALDEISGELHSGWRLDMAAPYTMTMATLDLDDPDGQSNLLVTTRDEASTHGVELRDPVVDIAATARLERRGSVPITGYRETFDDVRTTLHLPPGHRLLAAPGADAVRGAWLDSWRLLDVFLALIVVTAASRLLGIVPGLVAAAAMLLLMHEPFAPRWIWLNALIAIGLLRVAPEGRLRRAATLYRNATFAALALLLIPFTVTQLSTAVYPQLERPVLGRGLAQGLAINELDLGLASAPAAADEQRRTERFAPSSMPARLEEVVVTAAQAVDEPEPSRYLPGALLQAGPGLPDWTWTRATLSWTSPVDAEQTFRLIILDRWTLALWRIASVAAALALLLLLARPVLRVPTTLLRSGALGAAALVATLLVTPDASHAQTLEEFPPPGLLQELKDRLTEPAPCHPRCTELGQADARIAGDLLTLDLAYANQVSVAVPLPSTQNAWHATSITIDGNPTSELYIGADNRYWLVLEPGVHTVQLSGPLPDATSVTIPFPLHPRRVSTTTPGWDVVGVTDGRLLSGALELIRQQQGADDAATLGASEFAPFVTINRQLSMGIEWQLITRVVRVAPRDTAFSIELPLLAGEAVLSADIETANGVAVAAFAAGQNVVTWASRLPGITSTSLTAAEGVPWTERWLINIGPLWHAEIAGVPRTPENEGFFALDYSPRPGETLAIELTQPVPVVGDTIAIDSVSYTATVGERLTRADLAFQYRSTRAEQHVVTLPERSELDSVTVDGERLALRLEGRTLELPVTTGAHDVEIAWRIARDIGMRAALDPVDFGAGVSNLQTAISVPANRWVLWSFGPQLGSAVLYWSQLLIFAIFAVVLGRLRLSPLKTHEWLFLGLGLSTFAWPTLLLFAVWAFVTSWRATTSRQFDNRLHNALLLGLSVLSAGALIALLAAIPRGLLGTPDMQIVSPAGAGPLSWFADRSDGITPNAGVISVSLWFYRAAMLAWALWLSFALLRWLPWAWRSIGRDGLWRGKVATAS